MPPRDRKTAGTALTAYHWHGVPRQLLQDAIAKCRAQVPPISLKWKLVELLTAWVKTNGTQATRAEPTPRLAPTNQSEGDESTPQVPL